MLPRHNNFQSKCSCIKRYTKNNYTNVRCNLDKIEPNHIVLWIQVSRSWETEQNFLTVSFAKVPESGYQTLLPFGSCQSSLTGSQTWLSSFWRSHRWSPSYLLETPIVGSTELRLVQMQLEAEHGRSLPEPGRTNRQEPARARSPATPTWCLQWHFESYRQSLVRPASLLLSGSLFQQFLHSRCGVWENKTWVLNVFSWNILQSLLCSIEFRLSVAICCCVLVPSLPAVDMYCREAFDSHCWKWWAGRSVSISNWLQWQAEVQRKQKRIMVPWKHIEHRDALVVESFLDPFLGNCQLQICEPPALASCDWLDNTNDDYWL